MAKRMLIDTTHAEETRVVVVSGTRLEEFDVETSTKKQLKGNIYLAKVVRVEPSLQAAFVEYGGGRHGFLAFNEIHPDYFQIPVADRQALIAEQNDVMRQSSVAADFDDGDEEEATAAPPEPMVIESAGGATGGESPDSGDTASAEQTAEDDPVSRRQAAETAHDIDRVTDDDEAAAPDAAPESPDGSGETADRPRRRSLRSYKIQEVIKRRQILLVQVVKEERGNKGAALTTYLSLAGRYCVLMPNTARGGGVSRKITSVTDRKRLKSIVNDLDIPPGMAVIVRTAGSERTKPEIKRDYEYLLRLWDSVRDLTLKSTAPALVYEEANLIKRSIRDVYSRDIDEIHVEGEDGYRLAKDFMRMLTPSHAKKVQLYRDPAMPLFYKYQVEAQLDAMHSPVVQLKSGGYLVINQTEALVAIDVNSGRSTKERHIEETAFKTNLEASDEVARQLRLRDLAGLIVIDYIDMEESRNNHAVERRLKEAMRFDRARIQLGRISPFGLLELSRQRLRPSLMESSFLPCPHCDGSGMIRSVESASMHVLRAIEEEGVRRRSSEITVTVHGDVALYILNQKRAELGLMEARYGFRVFLTSDNALVPPALRMERVKSDVPIEIPAALPALIDDDPRDAEVEDDAVISAPEEDEIEAAAPAANGSDAAKDEIGEDGRRRRRRRRRRSKRDDAPLSAAEAAAEQAADDAAENLADGETSVAAPDGAVADAEPGDPAGDLADGQAAPRRRRGKRGGRRRQRRPGEQQGDQLELGTADSADAAPDQSPGDSQEPADQGTEAETGGEPAAPVKARRGRKKAEAAPDTTTATVAPGDAAAAKPKRTRRKAVAAAAEPVAVPPAIPDEAEAQAEAVPETSIEPAAAPVETAASLPPAAIDPNQPARKGWWNRFM